MIQTITVIGTIIALIYLVSLSLRLAVLAYAVKSILVFMFGAILSVLTLGGWLFFKRQRPR